MSKQEVIICQHFNTELSQKLSAHSYDKIFILTDEHTFRLCLPLLQDIALLKDAEQIVIGPEDVHKNLETLAYVWNQLSSRGATRHSLLINLGGGMVTDLGGFAAATFKRGIACINIPTTLLSMIDAAVGGKTGINFNGLKNEICAGSGLQCIRVVSPLFTDYVVSLFCRHFFECLLQQFPERGHCGYEATFGCGVRRAERRAE